MGTISDLNELTIPDPLDYMLVREASDLVDRDKKMKIGQLAFKAQTPVALANRIARWKDANTLEDSLIATTDLALKNVANTYTLLQTFNAGISFGDQTLSRYIIDSPVFTPAIQGSVSNPTTTGAFGASYTVFGNICFFILSVPVTTISGGSGDIRITLPKPVTGNNPDAVVRFNNLTLPANTVQLSFLPSSGTSYGRLIASLTTGAGPVLQMSALAAGSQIFATGFYLTP
jgi:hypothetical protein